MIQSVNRKFFTPGMILTLGTLLLSLLSCDTYRPVVLQKPIVFDQQRKQLTLEYLKDRYGIEQGDVQIQPRMIVLHWTAIPTLDKSYDAFYEPTLPGHRTQIKGAGQLNVSSHYLIDRDGSIYQLMPETTMARHVIGLNHCAIGIENVGGEEMPLTKEQLKANTWLIEQIKSRHPIEYLIGHQEYTLFENHPLWLEVDEGYRTEKTDPGLGFMKRIRSATRELGFKPLPVAEQKTQSNLP